MFSKIASLYFLHKLVLFNPVLARQEIFHPPLVRCTRRGLTKKIYAYVYIFRKAPSLTWRVREGALRKMYAYVYIFRKAPSRTWRVREGALRKIYAYVYIFRKAPSRTWRVREGALRARMCALVTFKFSRVTN